MKNQLLLPFALLLNAFAAFSQTADSTSATYHLAGDISLTNNGSYANIQNSLSLNANKVLKTNIEAGDDLSWNATLSYAFARQFSQKSRTP